MEQWQLALALLVAALSCLTTIAVCVSRSRPGLIRRALFALLVSSSLWCAATAVVVANDGASGLVSTWAVVSGQYGAAAALWFLARSVTDPSWRPSPLSFSAVWVVPQLALAVVFLADYVLVSPVVMIGDPGIAMSADRVILSVVLVLTLLTLVVTLRRVPGYVRRALTTLTLATAMALVVTAATIAEPDALGGTDYAPLAWAVTSLIWADALVRAHFVSLAPPAADHVLAGISDSVVVLDVAGRVVRMNHAALRIAVGSAEQSVAGLLGRPVAAVVHPAALPATEAEYGSATPIEMPSGLRWEGRTNRLDDPNGNHLGSVIVFREITDLVAQQARFDAAYLRLEQERMRLEVVNAQLNADLTFQELEKTQLAEDVVRDPLTGLNNRRRLGPAIDVAITTAKRTGRPFAVFVVDVDHFKEVNDTHGHDVGDRVLQALSRELMISAGPGATVVRYGGEEFVVVVPDVHPFDAIRHAEEIRAGLAGVHVPLRGAGPEGLMVTVSIGISSYPEHGETPSALVSAADDALYSAKAAGRNCVVVG